MAVNYTNLFTVLGKYIKHINSYDTLIGDISTDQDEIEAALNTAGLVHLSDGLQPVFEGFQDDISGWIDEIKSRMEEVITDRDTVIDELNIDTEDANSVIIALYKAMADDSESVNASSDPTLGSFTYDQENAVSSGIPWRVNTDNLLLNGEQRPSRVAPKNKHYGSETCSLTADDTVKIECVRDNLTGGAEIGSEVFRISGGPFTPPFSRQEEQIGSIGSIVSSTIEGTSRVGNGSFSDWPDGGAPAGWVVNNASFGSGFTRDSSLGFRGGNSLSADSGEIFTIGRDIPVDNLDKGHFYMPSFWARRASGSPTGNLSMNFRIYVGNQTILSNTSISSLSDLTTDWQLFSSRWSCPIEILAPVRFELLIDTTAANLGIYVNDIMLAKPVLVNGNAYIVATGDVLPRKNDTAIHTVSVSARGVIQNAFRQLWGFQLPRNAAGTETIADSLAT